jgi:myo-inositol-hexaphosphate 3-phosphohydrolase
VKREGTQDSADTKGSIFRCLLVILLPSFLLGCGTFIKRMNSPSTPFPHQWIGNIDRVNFKEPSGIVFHPGRETLFVVGDEGDICEIRRDGTLVKQKRICCADFEGIACDPSTGLLYIAIEGDEKIIEIDPEHFRVLREFVISRTFREAMVLKAGGHGIEAITFVPDSNHPEGGTFYVTNQGLDLDNREDPSAIFELEVPLRSSSSGDATAKIVRYFSLGVIDLSGLCYDEKSGHLYVMSDATNTFFEITREGKVLRAYAFPGENQEGIAVDANGFIYIAQDSGGIIKLKWNRTR